MKKTKIISFLITLTILTSIVFTGIIPGQATVVMTNTEFAEKAIEAAYAYHTVFARGVFGSPMTQSVIDTKKEQYPQWYSGDSLLGLQSKIGRGYFGFDEIYFIKALLWGWNGDLTKPYGGASYVNFGVPDVSIDEMLSICSNISSDFSNIIPGEFLYMNGHCGIYLGDGFAAECTQDWEGGVQITAVENISAQNNYNGRTWEKHAKLPFIAYISSNIIGNSNTRICETRYADGWLDVSISGALADDAWVGAYELPAIIYDGEHVSEAWHYTSDHFVTNYKHFDGKYNFTRIRFQVWLSDPTAYKVVLFRDSGYNMISQRAIDLIVSHPDQTIPQIGGDHLPAINVSQYAGYFGEKIDVTFYGVTSKNAWIGLYPVNVTNYNPCTSGMWCYTATGKQWGIQADNNVVRNGVVQISLNALDVNTGTVRDIQRGTYKVVLFGDSGYTNVLAVAEIRILVDLP